jgi:lipopolysaccharide export system protein LptC
MMIVELLAKQQKMKTFLTILVTGAAVAGLVYLLKDNDDVQDVLDKAKDKASGTLDKVKGAFYNAKGETTNQLSELS